MEILVAAMTKGFYLSVIGNKKTGSALSPNGCVVKRLHYGVSVSHLSPFSFSTSTKALRGVPQWR
jgi:hypothetical protein